MDRYFEHSRYYLERAVRTARTGVREEVASVGKRVRSLVGREREPEPGRFETVRSKFETVSARVRDETVAVVAETRESVVDYGSGEPRRSSDRGKQFLRAGLVYRRVSGLVI
ncbi:hypothetical protein I7X12_15070 [Halosimplex litoreum]|uniref:Uncharacterized protein n=1 Tax=Halosimplex litoreum TaxID=1198301 RepID=A0A7T3FWM9_9EURY|nr:hypothetical protein [Halosimplex litoreum]QPV62058.1 hypothetical protein I7X12_15070 [Halosimplex litoreum]